jgi:hypothetical protein
MGAEMPVASVIAVTMPIAAVVAVAANSRMI